jgi:hypothetical protein
MQAHNITDHDLLYTILPMSTGMQAHQSSETAPQQKGGPTAEQRVGHPRTETPAEDKKNRDDDRYYRWVEGECLNEYSKSAAQWAAHTSTEAFTEAFKAIAIKYAADNNARTAKIEEFLLTEAEIAGVITVQIKRKPKNPNKWAKHLAPWYDAQCKIARARY